MVIVPAVFIFAIKFGAHCRLKNHTPRKSELFSHNPEICWLTLLILYRISLTCFCCGAVLFNENRDLPNFTSPSSSLTPGFELKLQPTASQANILSMATASIASGESSDSLYILRNNLGDTFFDIDHSWLSCSLEKCSRRSSGTATVALELNNISDGRKLFFDRYSNNDRLCYCRCLPNTPVFREDLHICVNDVHECPLVSFVSGNVQQKIPYVFLPLKGQIIYPNAEIKFHGLNSVPTCIISRVRYLSRSGWVDVKNYSIAEYHHEHSAPFKLFHDKHRTFLQWFGNAELRAGMEGRLVLIDLICKDSDSQLIFTPCISFRVAGVPSSSHFFFDQVRDSSANLEKEKRFSSNEYVALGLAALLIGLIYVTSVFLYLRFKKNKLQESSSRRNNAFKTFVDLEENASHLFGETVGQSKQLIVEEEGLIKNNPLLMKRYHSPTAQLHKSSLSAVNESINVNSEHTENGSNSVDKVEIYSPSAQLASDRTRITAGIVHNKPFEGLEQRWSLFRNRLTTPFDGRSELKNKSNLGAAQTSLDSNNIQEKHPDENISIVERPEDIIQANSKHKLYFNPAYLEPELLMAPPPAAVEFLLKIREIMTIAKRKISSKKFLPSLTEIPEENQDEELQKSVPVVAKPAVKSFSKYEVIEPSKPKLVASINESNDKDKRQIIQKWLQSLPKTCSAAEESKMKLPAKAANTSPKPLPVTKLEQCNAPKVLKTFCAPPIPKQKSPEVPIRPKRLQQALAAEITARKKHLDEVNDEIDSHHYQTAAVVECRNAEPKEPVISAAATTLNSSLPLDEELTMQNTIYNVVTGNTTLSKLKLKYEGGDVDDGDPTDEPDRLSAEHIEGRYSLVSEVYVNDGFSSSSCSSSRASSLHSSTNSLVEPVTASERAAPPQPTNYQESSRLMIQLTDCPFFYSVESADDFEPDTLDRKPNRDMSTGSSSLSLYSKFIDSLERPAICLRTHGSFRNDSTVGRRIGELTRSFGSLQEIYQQRRKVDLPTCGAASQRSIQRDENAPQSLSPHVETLLWRKDTAQPRHYYRQRKLSPPPPLPPEDSGRRQPKPPLPPRKSETQNGGLKAQNLRNGSKGVLKATPNSCLSRALWSYRPEDSGYLSSSESEKSQKLTTKGVAKNCSRETSSNCINVVEATIKAKYCSNGILNDDDDDDDDDDDSMSSFNDANSESGAESTATNFKFYKNNSRIAVER